MFSIVTSSLLLFGYVFFLHACGMRFFLHSHVIFVSLFFPFPPCCRRLWIAFHETSRSRSGSCLTLKSCTASPLLTRASLLRCYFRHDFTPVFTQSDDFLAFDSWRGSLPYTALTTLNILGYL